MTDPTSPTTNCAHCDGVRFRWRVKRIRGTGRPASQRTIVWSCVGCGTELEEGITPSDGGNRADDHEPPSSLLTATH